MSATRSLKFCVLFLMIVFLGVSNTAFAQRVSLNEMDGKLNQLLNGQQNVNNHVTLRFGPLSSSLASCPGSYNYQELYPNGTSSSVYIVPDDHALIIHDMSFKIRTKASYSGRRVLHAELYSRLPHGSGMLVYKSPEIDIDENYVFNEPSISDASVAGVVIGPGRILCAVARGVPNVIDEELLVSVSFLHGYLVPYSE